MSDTMKAILVTVLILACLAFAGTIDHDEEVRHAQWMQELKDNGEWVMW